MPVSFTTWSIDAPIYAEPELSVPDGCVREFILIRDDGKVLARTSDGALSYTPTEEDAGHFLYQHELVLA